MAHIIKRLSGIVVLLLAAVVLLFGSFCERSLHASETGSAPVKEEKAPAPGSKFGTAVQGQEKPAAQDNPEETWGIKVLSARLVAQGLILDLRYTVTDAEKAAPVLQRGKEAYAVHEQTGKVLPVAVTKLGPMRQTGVKPHEKRVYSISFTNGGKLIKPNDTITLIIGEFQEQGIKVE